MPLHSSFCHEKMAGRGIVVVGIARWAAALFVVIAKIPWQYFLGMVTGGVNFAFAEIMTAPLSQSTAYASW